LYRLFFSSLHSFLSLATTYLPPLATNRNATPQQQANTLQGIAYPLSGVVEQRIGPRMNIATKSEFT
jgi:hypothetical protein